MALAQKKSAEIRSFCVETILDYLFSSESKNVVKKENKVMTVPANNIITPKSIMKETKKSGKKQKEEEEKFFEKQTDLIEQNRKRKLIISGNSVESGNRYFTHYQPNKRILVPQMNGEISRNFDEISKFFQFSVHFFSPQIQFDFFALFNSKLYDRVFPFFYPLTRDDDYKDVLIKKIDRSPFDSFIEKLFTENPVLFKLIFIGSHHSKSFCVFIPVIKSLFAFLVSHWYFKFLFFYFYIFIFYFYFYFYFFFNIFSFFLFLFLFFFFSFFL